MIKKTVLIVAISFGLGVISNAQTNEIKPQGIFKEIKVEVQNRTVESLQSKDKKKKQETIDAIIKNPNSYNPPVIYALSNELFNLGKKDDAAFWFYVGQLRARYDANLSLDKSSGQAVAVLNNEYGSRINKYAFKDIKKLENTVNKSVNFVRSNEENYDHRWINLHGMWAIESGLEGGSETLELSQPKEKFAEIKKTTVDEYYNDFMEFVKSQKK